MRPLSMSTAGPSSQRGVATLVSSVVFLFLSTLLVIFVSRSLLMEQRMSANEIRHKQAFEAAQAGLDQAMIFINTSPQGADKNADNTADGTVLATLANGSRYKVAFCDPTNLPVANTQLCPDDPAGTVACDVLNNQVNPGGINETTYMGTPLVVSCGWSDDVIAHHMVRQLIGSVSPIIAPPTNPLTAKGAMNVGGSANVVNYFNNLTVWSGGALSSIGNAGKTFVRNPTVSPPATGTVPPGPPNSCSTSADYACLTDKNTTGPDVIDNDPTLSNLTDDQMFSNYFGRTQDQLEAEAATQEITAAQAGTLAGVTGATVVVDGDTTLPNSVIGSRERPVVLVIDGDLDLQGTPTVNGIVYVRGNVTGGGNLTVNGAMLVEGTVEPTGSVDIIYDPFVTGNTANSGRPGWIPGTWRDWR